MPNADNHALIAQLDTLRACLQHEPSSPLIGQALHQCERLHLALTQFHAEGLRFAAFTLVRLTGQPGANLGAATQAAARTLKEGLDAAGYLSQH